MGRVVWPVKWVLVPAIFVALGYSCVGPRLAGKPARVIERVLRKELPPMQAPDETPPPKVTVGVHPVSDALDAPTTGTVPAPAAEEKPKPRHRRRRRRAVPIRRVPPVRNPSDR